MRDVLLLFPFWPPQVEYLGSEEPAPPLLWNTEAIIKPCSGGEVRSGEVRRWRDLASSG